MKQFCTLFLAPLCFIGGLLTPIQCSATDLAPTEAAEVNVNEQLVKKSSLISSREMGCPCKVPPQGPPGPPGPPGTSVQSIHNSLYVWDITPQNYSNGTSFQVVSFGSGSGTPILSPIDFWTSRVSGAGTAFTPNLTGRYYVTYRGQANFLTPATVGPLDLHISMRATVNGVEIPGTYAFCEFIVLTGDEPPLLLNQPITTSFIVDLLATDQLQIEFIANVVTGVTPGLNISNAIGTQTQIPTSASLDAMLIQKLP